jgi:hypothetical protein
VTSAAARLEVSWSRLVNLSVRSVSRSQTDPLIMGFVSKGGPKTLLMRAWGPALARFLGAGTMEDPVVALHDDIARGGLVLAQNDNWGSGGTARVDADIARLGAFAFPETASKDAALHYAVDGLATLYAFDKADKSGLTLVELYDVDDSQASRLVNLSARNHVGGGDELLVAGFSIKGNQSMRLLLRGVAPRLGLPPFGLGGLLADPLIKLYKIEGQVSTQIDSNDDWASGGVVAMRQAFTSVEAFDLPEETSRDAALVVSLQPGLYTVELHGKGGAAGDAMIEVYEMPQ